jgi:hypothetical protein
MKPASQLMVKSTPSCINFSTSISLSARRRQHLSTYKAAEELK